MKTMETILELIRLNPRGMTITDIASTIGHNRNTTAKYLEMLRISGNVEMIVIGPAKVFILSQRIPIQGILELRNEGILIVDSEICIISTNRTFQTMMGVEHISLLGKPLEECEFHLFSERNIVELAKNAVEGSSSRFDFKHSTDSGDTYFEVQFLPTAFDDGIKGAAIILVDITEIKEAEDMIKASEEKIQILLETIHEGVFIVQDEIITFCNSRLAKILGHEVEEVIGTPFQKYVSTEDLECVTTQYYECLAGIAPPTISNLSLVNKNGKCISCTLTVSVLTYEDRPTTLGIISDRSSQINVDKTIKETNRTMI
jgi:PAS domain S-box-containing protein